MATVARSPRRVKSAPEPVAAPEPAPAPIAPKYEPWPSTPSDLRTLMCSTLGYGAAYFLDAKAFHARHGSVEGADFLEPADWPAIDQAADNDAIRAEADAEPASPPEWPAWTDESRWELGPDPVIATEADRAWWASESPANRTGFVARRTPDARPVRLSGRRRFDPTAATDVRAEDLAGAGPCFGHH